MTDEERAWGFDVEGSAAELVTLITHETDEVVMLEHAQQYLRAALAAERERCAAHAPTIAQMIVKRLDLFSRFGLRDDKELQIEIDEIADEISAAIRALGDER